jgi:hypothetical protein
LHCLALKPAASLAQACSVQHCWGLCWPPTYIHQPRFVLGLVVDTKALCALPPLVFVLISHRRLPLQAAAGRHIEAGRTLRALGGLLLCEQIYAGGKTLQSDRQQVVVSLLLSWSKHASA